MIKAVVFDFGGVIVRTQTQAQRQKWECDLELGAGELSEIIFNSEIAVASSIGEATEDEIWQYVRKRLNLSPDKAAVLRHEFFCADQIDEELLEFIKHLRPSYKTAILSNAWMGARKLFTETYGLDKAFDEIIISSEEGIAKPDSRIYQRLAKKLNSLPQEILFVDDFSDNIRAAEKAGIQAILFTNTKDVIEEISSLLYH